jgi:hypothetical protein
LPGEAEEAMGVTEMFKTMMNEMKEMRGNDVASDELNPRSNGKCRVGKAGSCGG